MKGRNRRSQNRKKKDREKTEERERHNSPKEKKNQILGETMKSNSHKKDECANEHTMDVPKTRKLQLKSNRRQAFANALRNQKDRTELKGWLMPTTKLYNVLCAIIY